MRPKQFILSLTLLTLAAALALVTGQQASALTAKDPGQQAPTAGEAPLQPVVEDLPLPPFSSYLIALPAVTPNPAMVPPNLRPEQAAEYARWLTYRQAGAVLAKLERLRAERAIAGFEVRPDLHGVVVTGVTAQGASALSRLEGAAAVMPFTAAETLTCARGAAQALREQVLGLSRLVDGITRQPRAAATSLQTTDPSIQVYAPYRSTWTYILGNTTPATTVNMRILRGSQVVASGSTTSDGNGNYSFYPSWHHCPASGYDWTLRPGDVVEVTANGKTATTVVAYLSAWADPTTNVVAGRTDPGRLVEVKIYVHDSCWSTVTYSQTIPTDSSGNFTADFTSQVDFDRRDSATVYAYDADGNATFTSFDTYHIHAQFGGSSLYGSLKPNISFTASLKRGGTTVSTYSGQSDATGRFYAHFTHTIQAGDVIHADGEGVNVQYTVADLDVTLDPAADRVTGTTSADRPVEAYFSKTSWSLSLATTCSGGTSCASTTADSFGNFSLDTWVDLKRGDGVSIYIYDNEGNYQYASRYVPAIVADMQGNNIYGYWHDPTVGPVTVTLKSSGGGTKWSGTAQVDSWDGKFYAYPWATITPTDIIYVTDGAITETMTVQDLTAHLDGDTGHLTGNAYDGHLVARLWDFQREGAYFYWRCAETDVTGGTYDLTFSEADVEGQDSATVWSAGPDGHYTRRSAQAFSINTEIGSSRVWGYAETPGVPVTVTLQRNGNPVAVYTTTSSSSGYYDGYLSALQGSSLMGGGTTVPVASGDTLEVQAGDGDSVSLPIPDLTANADPANNRIYGTAPASEPVTVMARRYYRSGYYITQQTTDADSSGNYTADFDGLWWDSWSYGCEAVNMGHRCAQPAVYYYSSDGHRISSVGPEPSPVAADAYESDNTSTTARPYTGIQSHTFHEATDTDWVTFTVPAGDVNKATYRIETVNLGWGMDTILRLYDTDGYTLLAEDNDSGEGSASRIDWVPTMAGTYYVNIRPYSDDSTAYCDAVYDLMILPVRGRVYLPLVNQNW